MSKPETGSDTFGRFRLREQILEMAGMAEFVADEVLSEGSNGRQVSIAMLQFGLPAEAKGALLRSVALLKAITFRSFPAIREIEPEHESGLLVISDFWRSTKPLSEVIDEAKNRRIAPDLTFVLYVLKTMCSAISLLHQCRVSDFKTVHGALSPQTVWIDSTGTLRCRNHFFGLAVAHQQGHSLDEASDVRSLGELFWNLLSYEPWSGVAQVSNRASMEKRILEASGLLPGSGCSTVSEFSEVIGEVLASGTYFATQKYASHWLAHKRLPEVVSVRKKFASTPAAAPAEPRKRSQIARRSILPWIIGIIVLTMAAVFGVVHFLVQP